MTALLKLNCFLSTTVAKQGTSKAEGSPFFSQCFTYTFPYVVVAQSSMRSPAKLDVVGLNPVGVEFFFLFFFLY